MAKFEFFGPIGHRLRSFMALNRIALGVYGRHLIGRKIAPDWCVNTEIGIRFWRHQFTVAMNHADFAVGRSIFNSLLTLSDDVYEVETTLQSNPVGRWVVPKTIKTDAVLLYLHGGGYAFNGPISDRFAAMLAHHSGARLFMPAYRMTPEHAHPAQAEDALDAWQYLREDLPAEKLVIIGDSAGGHMCLTLLKSLRDWNEAQPALCVALCPWTDVGARGESMKTNDHFDLVQGWMALRFGEWLDPEGAFGREALSPINWDFKGLAPIYMQAGGREVLRDMIVEFAHVQVENGASIMFDLWGDMPHNFQAYDSFQASSTQALARIAAVVQSAGEGAITMPELPDVTQLVSGVFSDDQRE